MSEVRSLFSELAVLSVFAHLRNLVIPLPILGLAFSHVFLFSELVVLTVLTNVITPPPIPRHDLPILPPTPPET